MNVKYRKRFLKELAVIPSGIRREIEKFVFEDLPRIRSLSESGRVERMKGYPSYFKVRFGDYRIGIKARKDTVILERALHRKDIYRYFP